VSLSYGWNGSIRELIRPTSAGRYNSVIFSTVSDVGYNSFVVTEDFVQGAWWNETTLEGSSLVPLALDLQRNASKLTRLENAECLKAYGTSTFNPDWKNVLVITSLERNDTFVGFFYGSNTDWVCNGDWRVSCDVKSMISAASSWVIPDVQNCRTYSIEECNVISAPIQYCLAEPFTPVCSVRVSTTILVVVVICNIVKIASLLTTVFTAKFEPMITLGDAISAFVQRPDPFTTTAGALSRADVESAAKRGLSGRDGWVSSPYLQKTHRWRRAVGAKRWTMTILL
jgi:hypothetical protein